MPYLYRTCFAALLLALAAGDACAYLDPGTGSYAFQMAVALLLGIFFTVKTFFGNIKKILLDIFRKGR
jgi:hypothetical protein